MDGCGAILDTFLSKKRTGPENRPMRLEKSLIFGLVLLSFRLTVFLTRRLAEKLSEPIQDLVSPEPLEPVQRFVQARKLFIRDTADQFNGLEVLLIERIDDVADFLTLRSQADSD